MSQSIMAALNKCPRNHMITAHHSAHNLTSARVPTRPRKLPGTLRVDMDKLRCTRRSQGRMTHASRYNLQGYTK
jgi:hypothetical protein